MFPLSFCCLFHLVLEVWTAEDCATLQIFSGSFTSIISANSFEGKTYSIIRCKASLLEFLWISGRNSKHCWQAACCDAQLLFAVYQGCLDFNRWCPEYFLYYSYTSSRNVFCFFSSNEAFLCCKIWGECISFLQCLLCFNYAIITFIYRWE